LATSSGRVAIDRYYLDVRTNQMLPRPEGRTEIPRYGTHRDVLGLPARAVAITNSERTDAHCDLRWYYRHGLGLDTTRKAIPLSFGSAGHDAMQDLWGWWAATDSPYDARWFEECVWCAMNINQTPGEPCAACGGTGEGPVPRSLRQWQDAAMAAEIAYGAPEEDEDEDLPRRAERLRRVLDGYLRVYGTAPLADLRVVAVEQPIARAILGPQGKPYAPEVYLFRMADGGYRFARQGDDPQRVTTEKIPWYFVGVADVILASRNNGTLFVGEHKFSKQPETFFSGLTNDPQTTAYCWALDAVKGLLPIPSDLRSRGVTEYKRVAGYLYMVNQSSFQYDPEVLKNGALSVAKNRNVPSWRFRAMLQSENARQRGNPKLDPALYADHIAYLKGRDARLYRREPGSVGPIERERYGREVYAIAARHALARRDAWRASTDGAVIRAFPRTAVCRQPGGFCAFRGPCASATFRPDLNPGSAFVVSAGQKWYPDGALPRPYGAMVRPAIDPAVACDPDVTTQTESEPCPF
jgi:hypothetical protein